MPVLESERLRLRGHRLEDYATMVAIYGDAEVMRHISGRAQTPTESWVRLLRSVGHWQLLGYGFWAVEEKASGRYIGDVGFGDFHRAITPALDDIPEAGWVLAAHAHGKGYALEAMRAATRWMDQRSARTQCIISPSNVASQKVATKLGYGPSHDARHGDDTVTVWFRGGVGA